MKWCCVGFKAKYDQAGERGLAYLVGRDSMGYPEFQIQFRAVNKGDESEIDSTTLAAIIIDFRIVYCPSCGVELASFYQEHVDELTRDGFELGLTKKF